MDEADVFAQRKLGLAGEGTAVALEAACTMHRVAVDP